MRYYHWLCLGLIAACSETDKPEQQVKEPSIIEVVEEAPEPDPIVIGAFKQPEPEPDYSEFPERSRPYLHLITGQNKSWFAALIDTESRYNPFAESPRGAYGLTQIMPNNYEWLENDVCRHLGRAKPEDTAWQVSCGQALFEWGEKWAKGPLFDSYCDNEYIKSLLYNGGYYVIWEIKYSDGTIQGGKEICGTKLPNGRKRSKGSCMENYKYHVTISKKQKLFTNLGGKQCTTDF